MLFNFLLSDDASELVYSRMLAQEGSIISSNWYGSTELEILNTQFDLFSVVPFHIKLQVVRIMGQVILTLIFLPAICSVCEELIREKQVNVSGRQHFCW